MGRLRSVPPPARTFASKLRSRHEKPSEERFTESQREQLIERLRRGDAEALARVYDEHHEAVRAFAIRLLGEPEVADDLVHEVYCLLPRAIRSFRGDSSLRSFLIGIAANHARRHIRSAVRRRAAFDRLAAEPRPNSVDPEEAAKRKELAMLLSLALDQLPDLHRSVFVLCEIEQRSSGEVAELLGLCEGTVRSRVFYAKRRLREILEGRRGDEQFRGMAFSYESAA